MKKILVAFIALFAISGCSQTKIIKHSEYPFVIQEQVPQVEVLVHQDDEILYKSFIDALRRSIAEYERQIRDYKTSLK